MVMSYIIMVQYQSQGIHIGIVCVCVCDYIMCIDTGSHHLSQNTELFHYHKDLSHASPLESQPYPYL